MACPLNENGDAGDGIAWANHIGVPPGGRVEFIVKGPPAGVPGLFVTRTVDTGVGGENDPNRALATIMPVPDAPEPRSTLATSPEPLAPSALPWLGSVAPVRTRKLYFSEKFLDPNDPNSPTTFFITVDGQTPTPFDPASGVPDIVVKQGDVEDWIIENRSTELHAFHIHQIHFMLLDWSGRSGKRALSPRHDQRALLQRQDASISQRETAHGFSRSECSRHFRLPLSSFGTRRRRNDGTDSRGTGRAHQSTSGTARLAVERSPRRTQRQLN